VTKIYYLELLHASEGTLSCWSRLHLQSLAPTNPHWARVVGYGPFSLCITHKEGLCPSNGDINRLMMMMILLYLTSKITNYSRYNNLHKQKFQYRLKAHYGKLLGLDVLINSPLWWSRVPDYWAFRGLVKINGNSYIHHISHPLRGRIYPQMYPKAPPNILRENRAYVTGDNCINAILLKCKITVDI
jgi:hypothetical protein